MEISSFPFLEDCSYPFSLSFAQDPDPIMSFSNPKKRPREDDFDIDFSVDEFFSKVMAFDTPPEVKPDPHALPESADPNYKQFNSETNERSKRAVRSESDTTSCDSTGAAAGGGAQRRLWVKSRSKAWWEQVNSPDYPEEQFKRDFRMSRATFDMICEELESKVTKKDTMLRQAIPVHQRVAVCIWRLATGEALREVSKRFGLGISTCHKLVLEVCTAIRSVLMPKFLEWPDDHRLLEIKREFELLSGIPNVCGSMYTTHIPIIAPKTNVAAYFNKWHTERNQKTCYSVAVQGVVGPTGAFTDISIGWPGSMTNEQVLDKSSLSKGADRGALKGSWVVGGSSHPLTDWVLVPYNHPNLTWAQHAYNEKIEDIQRVAREAFGQLKGRWGCLQKRTEMKLQDLPVVLGACFVLHNICQMRNECFGSDSKFEGFDSEVGPENGVRTINAAQARDRIAHMLLHRDIGRGDFVL